MKPGYGAERVYNENGCVYVIRDLWEEDASTPSGVRLQRCEYKMKDDAGQPHWRPCREGVSFREIEPYEYVMPTRDWAV